MNIVAQNINLQMKAAGLTIVALEARAGIKPYVVRNIVTGKSMNPSAVNLQAIADALDCSIKADLLETPKGLQQDEFCLSAEEALLQKNHTSSALMEECVHVVNELLQKNKETITTAQYLTCVREVYLYSLERTPQTTNRAFAEWFIPLTYNYKGGSFYKSQNSRRAPRGSRQFEL